MSKRSNKSMKHRVWNTLRSRKLGGTFKTKSVASVLMRAGDDPSHVRKSVASVASVLQRQGLLERVGYGMYRLTPEFFRWGENEKFEASKPRKREPAPVVETVEPEIIRHPQVFTQQPQQTEMVYEVDVIENLLSAMAEAEPELRRLMEQDKRLKEMTNG